MTSFNLHTTIRRRTVMRFVGMDSTWASVSAMMAIVKTRMDAHRVAELREVINVGEAHQHPKIYAKKYCPF